MRPFTFGLALLPLLSAAWLVDPPTTAAPDTIQDCTWWAVVEPEEATCEKLVNAYVFSMRLFKQYNPSTVDNCNLVVGNSYCIEQSYETPVEPPSEAELLDYCQKTGYHYAQYCERCMYRCTTQPLWYDKCFDDLFFNIKYIQNGCTMNGNKDCEKYAVDYMCKAQ